MNKSISRLTVCFILLIISSCKDDNKEEDLIVDFDQNSLLINLSQNQIIPNYNRLKTNVNELTQKVDSFITMPDANSLIEVKNAYSDSYISWQKVSFLEFGPAATIGLRSEVNIYPTNTSLIEQNIVANSYNLDAFSNLSAKGFPAIDYLLFSNEDSTILEAFKRTNRQTYLKNVVENLNTKISQTVNMWNTSYGSDFNNQLGTDIGSSVGLLINALNQHYERNFRDGKIGIPLGVRSSGSIRINDTEALYSDISFDLVKSNFNAMKSIYFGGTGLGLDDYLIASDATEVNDIIKSQISTIDMEINQYPGSVVDAITNQNQDLLHTYQEIQKLIVYWKVDMPSRLGILITYQDNDGD